MITTTEVNELLKTNLKLKNEINVSALRQIKSLYVKYADKEIDITPENILKIIKYLIDSELKTIVYKTTQITSDKDAAEFINNNREMLISKSEYIKFLISLLPKEKSEEEIKQWIKKNIDFSKFNPRIKCMKEVKTQFSEVDGNKLKTIILSM